MKPFAFPARLVAPLIPYVAVGIGLLLLKNAWVAMIGYHAGMCAMITLERRWYLASDLFKGAQSRLLALSVLVGSMSGLVLYNIWPWIGVNTNLNVVLVDYGLSGSGWLLFIAYFCFVNPWLEELYWRGYLGNPALFPTRTDLWFAGYHPMVLAGLIATNWAILTLAVLVIAAWFWRQLARAGKGLMMPAISHFAADASIVLTVYALSLR